LFCGFIRSIADRTSRISRTLDLLLRVGGPLLRTPRISRTFELQMLKLMPLTSPFTRTVGPPPGPPPKCGSWIIYFFKKTITVKVFLPLCQLCKF
jgi:hypothetical protein